MLRASNKKPGAAVIVSMTVSAGRDVGSTMAPRPKPRHYQTGDLEGDFFRGPRRYGYDKLRMSGITR